jgi:hypothetical protein
LSSREAAERFAQELETIVDKGAIHVHPVSYNADLYDIDVSHDALGMTLCFDIPGETVRIILDDDVVDGLSPSEAFEYITALAAGQQPPQSK